MLKERLAGEMLIVGIFDLPGDDRLVREPEGVLAATPLRQRMIEDMRIRSIAEKTQAAHIRAARDFALFLK